MSMNNHFPQNLSDINWSKYSRQGMFPTDQNVQSSCSMYAIGQNNHVPQGTSLVDQTDGSHGTNMSALSPNNQFSQHMSPSAASQLTPQQKASIRESFASRVQQVTQQKDTEIAQLKTQLGESLDTNRQLIDINQKFQQHVASLRNENGRLAKEANAATERHNAMGKTIDGFKKDSLQLKTSWQQLWREKQQLCHDNQYLRTFLNAAMATLDYANVPRPQPPPPQAFMAPAGSTYTQPQARIDLPNAANPHQPQHQQHTIPSQQQRRHVRSQHNGLQAVHSQRQTPQQATRPSPQAFNSPAAYQGAQNALSNGTKPGQPNNDSRPPENSTGTNLNGHHMTAVNNDRPVPAATLAVAAQSTNPTRHAQNKSALENPQTNTTAEITNIASALDGTCQANTTNQESQACKSGGTTGAVDSEPIVIEDEEPHQRANTTAHPDTPEIDLTSVDGSSATSRAATTTANSSSSSPPESGPAPVTGKRKRKEKPWWMQTNDAGLYAYQHGGESIPAKDIRKKEEAERFKRKRLGCDKPVDQELTEQDLEKMRQKEAELQAKEDERRRQLEFERKKKELEEQYAKELAMKAEAERKAKLAAAREQKQLARENLEQHRAACRKEREREEQEEKERKQREEETKVKAERERREKIRRQQRRGLGDPSFASEDSLFDGEVEEWEGVATQDSTETAAPAVQEQAAQDEELTQEETDSFFAELGVEEAEGEDTPVDGHLMEAVAGMEEKQQATPSDDVEYEEDGSVISEEE